MTTVYVLTEGEYSDYHIVGVFSSPEAAESVARQLEDADTEEYVLDEMVGKVYAPECYAYIDAVTGEVYSSGGGKWGREWFDGPHACRVEPTTSPCGNRAIRVFSPVSAEHAVKVAVEARQKMLREQAQSPAKED